MPSTSDNLKDSLIVALQSAASYNDKGYIWMGHSPAKSAEMEQEFQERLLVLAAHIGSDTLGPELSSAIASVAASQDSSGEFVSIARRRFGGSNGA